MAANSRLRERFLDACATDGLRGFLPSWAMCTDNAAMVASAAWYRWQSDGPSPLDTGALPNLGHPDPVGLAAGHRGSWCRPDHAPFSAIEERARRTG